MFDTLKTIRTPAADASAGSRFSAGSSDNGYPIALVSGWTAGDPAA